MRGQIGRLVTDLPAEALNWRPVDGPADHSTNSLAVLALHVAGAEHFWIAEVIGRHPPTRDREAEFVQQVDDWAKLTGRLEQVGRQTREVLSGLADAELGDLRAARDKHVSVRWALLHVIDHTALHLGHMQLTYQLWMGGQAADAPRWFQRLPDRR